MQIERSGFIQDLFSFLHEFPYLSVKYVLESPKNLPTTSDIDLLVQPGILKDIKHFCQQHSAVCNIGTEICGERHTLRIYFWEGSFLKIDLLTAFLWKGQVYINADKCFEHQQRRGDVKTYHCIHLLEHVFLYYFLNGSGVPKKYIEYFEQLPPSHKPALLPYLKQQYNISFSSINALGKFRLKAKEKLARIVQSRPENSKIKVFQRRLKQWKGQCWYWFSKKGKVVTFSGVDGAGKTTILTALSTILREERNEKVKVIRHRPGIFPILSALRMGRKAASDYHAEHLPRTGTNNSLISSLIRFAYYYLDYIIGQWWVQLRYCSIGYTVVYDRYYFDFIADPRRSNVVLPQGLTRRLYQLLLPPELNFFLYASPTSILKRKQELDQATIVQLTESYKDLFHCLQQQGRSGTYRCIENEQLGESLREILQWYNLKTA